MGSEWKKRKVETLGRVVTGKTPSTTNPDNFNGPYPFITIPDLNGRVFIDKIERSISEVGAEKIRSCLLPAGAVMMSCIATVGKCGITTKPSFTNQQINSVICNSDVDPLFLYYRFTQLGYELEAAGGGGSVYTNVSKSRFSEIEVEIPEDIVEQRAIAHYLGSLDDKIELNLKMNETLEAVARAIFKSWFVDFLPVRAKAEGHDTGLPKEIADLFPDSFEDSELGDIPKGWHTNTLGNILELAYGKALKEAVRRPGSIPVFGSNGQVGWHDEKLTEGPGIVVGRKGNPGIVTWVHTDFFPIDTTFYVVPKGECRSLYFLFYALQAQDIASLGADSAVPGLNRNLAYMNEQVVPPPDILNAFDKQVRPLFNRIYQNTKESRTLATVRDTLLSKLLSGEIRIKNAEKIILAETGQHEQLIEAIYTIGHSNHSVQDFITLLKRHAITAIADVRSSPFSRRNPQFNQAAITAALKKVGIAYVFLGEELGGRPNDTDCYNNGAANFEKMAERPVFKRGIDRLLTGRDKYRIALLCAEKEPLDCHRTILVCHYLRRLGLPIKHILSDGSIEEHHETERRLVNTFGLDNSLFDTGLSDSERIEKAYKQQASKIAYKSTGNEENHGHTK
jgi:type I restriction enzyme S subunit